MEALIKSGCMDDLPAGGQAGADRGILLANLESMLTYNHEGNKQNENQVSLFGGITKIEAPEFKLQMLPKQLKRKKLLWEKNCWDFIFWTSTR